MKIKFLTTASNPTNEGWLALERSLVKHGWDYQLIVVEWRGYASKLLDLYDYLKSGAEDETDLIIYSDSYDSIMLASPNEVLEKFKKYYLRRIEGLEVESDDKIKVAIENKPPQILWYAERACWPYGEWTYLYPDSPTPYKHLNGGGFIATPQQIINLIEINPVVPSVEFNDQVHNAKIFLTKNHIANIQLDYYCEIFQCMAHAGESDFSVVDGRVKNNITGTMPAILHCNGHSVNDINVQNILNQL
jgi:hypothetical protein